MSGTLSCAFGSRIQKAHAAAIGLLAHAMCLDIRTHSQVAAVMCPCTAAADMQDGAHIGLSFFQLPLPLCCKLSFVPGQPAPEQGSCSVFRPVCSLSSHLCNFQALQLLCCWELRCVRPAL